MTKTIIIMDAPDSAAGINQVGDENAYFLGAFGEVIAALKQVFPQGDFSDPTEITAETNMGDIRIEIGKHTPVQSFMMHLEKQEGLELVQKLCDRTRWRALDTDTGTFIDKHTKSSDAKQSDYGKDWWKFWKK